MNACLCHSARSWPRGPGYELHRCAGRISSSSPIPWLIPYFFSSKPPGLSGPWWSVDVRLTRCVCSPALSALSVIISFTLNLILHLYLSGIKPLFPILSRVKLERLFEGRKSYVEWAAYRHYDLVVPGRPSAIGQYERVAAGPDLADVPDKRI